MRRIFLLGALIAAAIVIAVFWFKPYRIAPPSNKFQLGRVSWRDLPGWYADDAAPALTAFRRSCAVLAREQPLSAMGGAGYAGAVGEWHDACAAAPGGKVSAAGARNYFQTWFVPLAITAGGKPDALFTGYYEPEIHGSKWRHDGYTTPVYGVPGDLVTVDLGQFRQQLKGLHIEGRVSGHALVPYFNRAEIDEHGLPRAPVLLYANDPINVFFLHIQGSGRVHLDSGQMLRLSYAGQNGRPYTPVGRSLIAQGALERSQMSMQAIRAWMEAHPDEARAVMETDQSFVFFREAPLGDPALGSPGSEGVPLTPEASIAVDEQVHPLGAPLFIAATAPDPDPSKPDRALTHLFVAQDTGGAIKGAARADVFWGFGPDAESVAGRMKSQGRLYVLLPKPVASRIFPHTEY